MLVHAGSGSGKFEEAVGLEKIRAFIDDVAAGAGLDVQLAWFSEAFEVVSKAADGCGAEYRALVATRDDPIFRSVE